MKRLSMYEPNYRCYEYIHPEMIEDAHGDYVEYKAYLELQKENERLREALDQQFVQYERNFKGKQK